MVPPSMSIPDRKMVSTSRLSCWIGSLVLPYTPLRLVVLSVMFSSLQASPQLTVSSDVPLQRFPVPSSTASVSPA